MVLHMLLCLIYILYIFAMCTSNGMEVMVHSGETISHRSSPPAGLFFILSNKTLLFISRFLHLVKKIVFIYKLQE